MTRPVLRGQVQGPHALSRIIVRVLKEHGGSIPREDLPDQVRHYDYATDQEIDRAVEALQADGKIAYGFSDEPLELEVGR